MVKTQGHVDLVEVEVVLFKGVFFEAVLDEAEGLVEVESGEIVADNGELEEFDARPGSINHRLNEKTRGAGATMAGADVHGAEPALVGVLAAGESAEGGSADKVEAVEGTEDLGIGEAAGIFFQGSGLFLFESAAEGFGVEAESFEADFAEEFDV